MGFYLKTAFGLLVALTVCGAQPVNPSASGEEAHTVKWTQAVPNSNEVVEGAILSENDYAYVFSKGNRRAGIVASTTLLVYVEINQTMMITRPEGDFPCFIEMTDLSQSEFVRRLDENPTGLNTEVTRTELTDGTGSSMSAENIERILALNENIEPLCDGQFVLIDLSEDREAVNATTLAANDDITFYIPYIAIDLVVPPNENESEDEDKAKKERLMKFFQKMKGDSEKKGWGKEKEHSSEEEHEKKGSWLKKTWGKKEHSSEESKEHSWGKKGHAAKKHSWGKKEHESEESKEHSWGKKGHGDKKHSWGKKEDSSEEKSWGKKKSGRRGGRRH